LSKDVTCSVLLGKTGWVLICENAKQETNEVPKTDKNTVVSPAALFRDRLSIEYRGAERKDGEDHQADVFATALYRNNFARSSECDEFVETGADTREYISSLEFSAT
jgi:hypothetical protein